MDKTIWKRKRECDCYGDGVNEFVLPSILPSSSPSWWHHS